MSVVASTQTKTRMSFMTNYKSAIEELAHVQDRSSSYIINKAISEYLKVQNWQVKHIRDAVNAADRGEFVDGHWEDVIDNIVAGK